MNSRCEQFGELISGLIDNELTAEETRRVMSHLQRCPSCQQTKAQFEMIDRTIQHPSSSGPLNPSTSVIKDRDFGRAGHSNLKSQKADGPNRRLLRRPVWMPMALTTAALVLLGLTIFWPTPNAGAFSPEVSIPNLELDDIKTLNQNTRKNADSTLKTMELQLRIMRVEANRLDSNTDGKSELTSEIERVLAAIAQLESE